MTDEEKINLLSKAQGEIDRAYFGLERELESAINPIDAIFSIIAYQTQCGLLINEVAQLLGEKAENLVEINRLETK